MVARSARGTAPRTVTFVLIRFTRSAGAQLRQMTSAFHPNHRRYATPPRNTYIFIFNSSIPNSAFPSTLLEPGAEYSSSARQRYPFPGAIILPVFLIDADRVRFTVLPSGVSTHSTVTVARNKGGSARASARRLPESLLNARRRWIIYSGPGQKTWKSRDSRVHQLPHSRARAFPSRVMRGLKLKIPVPHMHRLSSPVAATGSLVQLLKSEPASEPVSRKRRSEKRRRDPSCVAYHSSKLNSAQLS